MKKIVFVIFIVALIITLFYQCEKREWQNPYGGELDPAYWAVDYFKVEPGENINEAKLNWQAVDKNIEGYKIFRNYSDKGMLKDTCIVTLDKDVTTFVDSQVIPDSLLNYIYRIYSYAGDYMSLEKTDTIKPAFPTPTNFRYTIDNSKMILYWNDNSKGEDGYEIYYKDDNGNSPKLTTDENEIDIPILFNTRIQIQIRAYKENVFTEPLYGFLYIPYTKSSIVFGGSQNEVLNSICKTSELGRDYIAVGSTKSPDFAISNYTDPSYSNSENALLVSLDENLNINGFKSFGGTGTDSFKEVVAVSDGIVVLGESNSSDFDCIKNAGGEQNWVLKLNYKLETVWSKFLPGIINDIKAQSNGNTVLCGESNKKGWIIILDREGEILVDKTIEGVGDRFAFNESYVMKDGTILIVGNTYHNRSSSYDEIYEIPCSCVLKLTSSGDTLWSTDLYDSNKLSYRDGGINGKHIGVINISSYGSNYVVAASPYSWYSGDDGVQLDVLDLEGTSIKSYKVGESLSSENLGVINSMICVRDTLIYTGEYVEGSRIRSFVYSEYLYEHPVGSIWNPTTNYYWDSENINTLYNFSVLNCSLITDNTGVLSVGWAARANDRYDWDCWIVEN